MQIEQTALPGVVILTPARFGDSRGFFSESWNRSTLANAGVNLPEFVQDNHSMSHQAGTLRGLHYQAPPHAQGKLVRCGRGHIYDVAVDVRRGSPTFGQWVGVDLTYDNGRQLWIPAGFLHGFVTRTPDSEIIYKCSAHYNRDSDGAVRWDSLGIDWDVTDPLLSDKDQLAPAFDDWHSPFEYKETA
ncbi:dTDP-4-dehydrorhamnose 3,5-epimerase [Paracoccus sp. (in: a-proteobacteria)]|uniref:dTDP-4-dehydrorhamnose 3,5-epimerase n=1 Tax=Paracoccus sp. TaxID=267 RepID=UPI0026E0279A|nr:dTDP-4-dehydrorhamnose 3,5-epimerase [Paracoccus sp. (in: a-proteobacteria)]MDO5647768.1 dTDP-4-dehydrorhamnose 3,5-epimerase [Paracoccus sp. (in: a-proteobacteria)]